MFIATSSTTVLVLREASKEFPEDQPVVICSDSPEWVNEQGLFSGDRFLVSEPTDKYSDGSYEPFVDLCIMSLCSGLIINAHHCHGGVHGCRTREAKLSHLNNGSELITRTRIQRTCTAARMDRNLIVIDNFLDDPDRIRFHALSLDFDRIQKS